MRRPTVQAVVEVQERLVQPQERWNKLTVREVSLVTAVSETAAWFLAHRWAPFHNLVNRMEPDAEFLVAGLIMFISLVFGIKAAMTLTQVGTEFMNSEDAIEDGDEYAFRKNARRRIPRPIKELLATMGIMVLICFFLFPYHTTSAGLISNFMVAYVLMAYRAVSTRLDDPSNPEWGLKIPQRWRKPIYVTSGDLMIPHSAYIPGLHIDEWPHTKSGLFVLRPSALRGYQLVNEVETMRRMDPVRRSQALAMCEK